MNTNAKIGAALFGASAAAIVMGAIMTQGTVGFTTGHVVADPTTVGAMPLVARYLDRQLIPEGGIPAYYADGGLADPQFWTYRVARPMPHPCESTLADGGPCAGYWRLDLPEAGVAKLTALQNACNNWITAGHIPDGGPVPLWCPKIVLWTVQGTLGADWDERDANTRGISWDASVVPDDYAGQTP